MCRGPPHASASCGSHPAVLARSCSGDTPRTPRRAGMSKHSDDTPRTPRRVGVDTPRTPRLIHLGHLGGPDVPCLASGHLGHLTLRHHHRRPSAAQRVSKHSAAHVSATPRTPDVAAASSAADSTWRPSAAQRASKCSAANISATPRTPDVAAASSAATAWSRQPQHPLPSAKQVRMRRILSAWCTKNFAAPLAQGLQVFSLE